MTYPDKKMVVDTLIEAARHAGMESNANHPEDIANAMINAVESGATVIQILHESGDLNKKERVS